MTGATRPPQHDRVASQFSWITAGNVAASVTQAATFVVLARWAGPEEFGLITSILALIFILQTLSDLGIAVYLTRLRATNANDPRIRLALRINTYTAFALGLAVGGLIVLASFYVDQTCLQLLPLAIWSAADRNTDTWLGITIADGDAQINAISIVIRRISVMAVFCVLAFAGLPALLAYSLGCCLVAYSANVWARRIVHKRVATSSRSASRMQVVRAARPYWIASIAAHGRNVDVLIVGALAGPVQAAYYAAASRITGPLRLLPSSLATVLVPTIARTGGNARAALRPAVAVLGFVMVMYVVLVIAAPILVPLAIGDSYAGAVAPLQIVVAGLIFAAAASIIGAVLQGLGAPEVTAKAGVVSTVICIGGVIIGAALAGAIGASMALLASFVVQAAMLSGGLLRHARGRSRDVQSNEMSTSSGRGRLRDGGQVMEGMVCRKESSTQIGDPIAIEDPTNVAIEDPTNDRL